MNGGRQGDQVFTWIGLEVDPLEDQFLDPVFPLEGIGGLRVFDPARTEGVSEWKIFSDAALPMARPTPAALSISLFLAS